jgi:hypothetical protein
LFHLIPHGDEHEPTRTKTVSEQWASTSELARIVTSSTVTETFTETRLVFLQILNKKAGANGRIRTDDLRFTKLRNGIFGDWDGRAAASPYSLRSPSLRADGLESEDVYKGSFDRVPCHFLSPGWERSPSPN